MHKCSTLIVLAILLCAPAISRADDQDAIDYRTHVMKTMGEQMGAIGMILGKKAPPDNFAVHLKVLAVTATQAKRAFQDKVPGGNAKPEVWSNWTDFAKRLDELVATTADLAATANTEDVATVGRKMQAGLTCKGCHDNYRVPPK